jgi:hypothetical protein
MLQRELNALEARKRLLIAESEINRTLLQREYRELADRIREAGQPMKNLGLLAASATPLLVLLKVLPSGSHNGHGSGANDHPRPRFFSPLNLLRFGLGLWTGLHKSRE